MKRLLLVLVAILATAAALAQCGGDETPAEGLSTCTSCDALEVSPQQGKVPCNGTCEVEPDAGEWYKCVGAVDDAGGHCVPVAESYNGCIDNLDNDEDGLADCADPDCAETAPCLACAKACDGKVCGPDGCGGECGQCAANEVCLDGGTCFCPPQCTGKQCGDNGCSGFCGTCPAGTTCGATGMCAPDPCVPNCGVKVCGNDGCDGTCGECADDEVCTATGTCILGPCVPDCTGKVCGSDGCYGSCGECAANETCAAGVSCLPCTPICDPINECGPDGCGGVCGVCVVGEVCLATGACFCPPQCTGKNCGDDGCGNSCGTCPVGMTCGATGMCAPDSCVPNCTGKVCGNDGCGGLCGKCADNENCTLTGTCIPKGPVVPDEICDNMMDDDGDLKADAADSDCAKKIVATLGIYFAAPAFLRVETSDGESVEVNYAEDWTSTITILGEESPAKVWVESASISATSPQGFVVWDGGTSVATPGWPVGNGLPVAAGKSFSASFNEVKWFNLELSGYGSN